jgi:hypothetical protein
MSHAITHCPHGLPCDSHGVLYESEDDREQREAKETIVNHLRDIHAVLGMNLRHDTDDMSEVVIHRTSYAWNKLGDIIAAFEAAS